MAAVDYAEAWARLRAVVLEKPSHGQRDLVLAMARIEAQVRVEPSERERFLRLFLDDLEGAFLNVTPHQAAGSPLTEAHARAAAMASAPHPRSPAPAGHEGAPDDRADHARRPHVRAAA